MALIGYELKNFAPRAAVELRDKFTPASGATYTPSNVTTTRTYDADSGAADTARINELADVVGTLIADLQAKGLIG